MIQIRKASERGHFDHGWLNTYHSFSFADYYDPKNMGFRTLRVINEDWVQPGEGFGTHGHRDMEIITYILNGSLQHRDSMGNGSVIQKGEIQYMSAGTGVTHSEFNPSSQEPLHLMQIWILPDQHGYSPTYNQREVSKQDKLNHLRLLASGTGEKQSIQIRQDAKLYASILEPHQSLEFVPEKKRHIWIQVLNGSLQLNSSNLESGDAAAISGEALLKMTAGTTSSEFLLFDLN